MYKKIEIVIATHSELAAGFKKTIEFIAGKQKNIAYFSAYTTNCKNFDRIIDTYLAQLNVDGIIILTDLFGGSVNNHIMKILANDCRIHLITGINLPLVLSLITNVKGNNIENEIKKAITESKNGIIYCNELSKKKVVNNLDEF